MVSRTNISTVGKHFSWWIELIVMFAISDINNRQINQLKLLRKYSSLINQAPSSDITNLTWFHVRRDVSIMRWQTNWTRLKLPFDSLNFKQSYIILMKSLIELPNENLRLSTDRLEQKLTNFPIIWGRSIFMWNNILDFVSWFVVVKFIVIEVSLSGKSFYLIWVFKLIILVEKRNEACYKAANCHPKPTF